MFRSFKTRLGAFIVGFVLITSVLMAILCYRFIYQNIISVSIQYNNQIVNQLCKNIELFMEGIDDEIESLSYYSEIRFYGSNFITPGLSPSRDSVKKVLWNAVSHQKSLDDISIIYNEEKILSLFNMYEEDSVLELCRYYDEKEVLLNARFVPIIHSNSNGHPALSCIKAVTNSSVTNGYYVVGSVVLDDIFAMLNAVELGEGSGSCLIDTKGTVQYSTLVEDNFTSDINELIQQRNLKEKTGFVTRISGQKYIVSVYPLNNSNLSTMVYIPLATVTESAAPLLYAMLGTIFLFLAISVVISIRLSNRLTAPVTTLAVHIRNWDGFVAELPHVKGTEETDILYQSFKEMIARITLLMEKNALENRQKRKAELLALQAQINPHFLYNTLDSINALAILRDDKDISNMTTSLAHLLRLSIGHPDEFVTLKDEIKHIQAYLTIQKIRYNDKFSVIFNIDPDILSTPVIRLILQPLIENCIYHGFETGEKKGIITVNILNQDENVEIQVIDNGLGVPPETEALIQKNLISGKKPGENCSVGIYNVNERIRLYYGKQAFVSFKSILNEGTTVTVSFPKKKEENCNEKSTDSRG